MGNFRNAVCFLVALVVPAVAFAVTQPVCKYGPVTPESYKWNFSKEAAGLLAQIHDEAYHAGKDAGTLQAYDREPGLIDWRADAQTLTREKRWDNLMDQHLCRLRFIARALPQYQRAQINALAPAVIETSDVTQAALTYLDHHENELFAPRYANYADDLYVETNRIESTTSGNSPTLAMKSGTSTSANTTS